MAKNEGNTKEEVVDIAIEGELTEEELESIVGGCGDKHHHHGCHPLNRVID